LPEANLVLARLWEAQGDLPRALAALRRRGAYYMEAPFFMTTFLREEGRLAALTGDTVSAIRAYRHYLGLRYDPEPQLRPEVERVRQALARLEGRGGLS
jgi:serine/threonine-protein kinase